MGETTTTTHGAAVAGGGGHTAATPSAPAPPAAESPWRRLFHFRAEVPHSIAAFVGGATFVTLLLAWLILTEGGLIPPHYLPSPLAVGGALVTLFAEQGFATDVGVSIARVWIAFAAAALMAIPLGILMSTLPIVRHTTEPVVDFIRYLPVPALVPLTIIWLGIGELSKITLLWMGTFFQLVLLIADDAKRVPREYIEIGRTLGVKDRGLLRHIILPAMSPSMVDNLRITLGWCWTYLIIAEIVAASSGIGYVIWAARRFVKTPEVFAGILVIGLIGLATDQAIRALHRRFFRYLR